METPPGGAPLAVELRRRLESALAARGPDYEPRTELLTPDGRPRFTNRLILEDSPYLIQHAHNPVQWFAWGEEAFARARRENKAIFLSIGYSTCHWCHVMERESFDNVEIARLMNEKFVCIKVDREERPDLDEIYMTAVQLYSGHGGWPMSSFLTPEGKPFFGGTYFPPQAFVGLLQRVDQAWQDRRPELDSTADRLFAAVEQVTAARGEAAEVGREAGRRAVEQTVSRHDRERGGFGAAPKFPHEPELLLLLATSLRSRGSDETGALAAAEKSLTAMAQGGIYDQVGGGFHRYSTDEDWLVPHFEKMLYNQAHLSRAYLAAYALTGKRAYARVARQTLDYVLREMTSPEGGFYSATDADSEGREGEFFVWTPEEIRRALSPPLADLALELYGVSEEGNFEGKNILHLPHSLEELARRRDIPEADLIEQVDDIRERLWQVRDQRVHPLRDDKILTAWNGMMITSFAVASEVLGETRYLEAAVRAAELVWRVNRKGEGALWRLHLDGSSSTPAVQEDYAYLTEALVALYDASGDEVWLQRATEVADGMLARFWDERAGGFFMSAEGEDPLLLTRPKSPSDGAIPSGNSVAVRALTLLANRTGNEEYRHRTRRTLQAFGGQIKASPGAHSYMLLGADELLSGEVGPRRYGAAGNVRATARWVAQKDRLEVDVRVRDGWHVNAHEPLTDNLVPTELGLADARGWRLDDVDYPEARRVRLGFQQDPLAVYQGRFTLAASLTREGEERPPVLAVRLKLQACDERVCLPPEELVLEVPAGDG